MHLGDLAADRRQWLAAADLYGRAWDAGERKKPTPLWLKGRALVRAGQQDAGSHLIEIARMMPLGNAQTRLELATELAARGLNDEAARQWELIVRTGEFQSAAVSRAAAMLATRYADDQPDLAARYYQWPLLRCLRTSSTASGVESHLRQAFAIHVARSRTLLAAAKTDEALEEIESARSLIPGSVELAVAVVPQLDEAGLKPAADGLFAKEYAVNERVCRDFPNSARHHCRLACLSARCGRRLDAGLAHGQRAAALEPGDPVTLDAMAEIHFRLGDRPKAIELAQRCVELAPEAERYRRQLARFQER